MHVRGIFSRPPEIAHGLVDLVGHPDRLEFARRGINDGAAMISVLSTPCKSPEGARETDRQRQGSTNGNRNSFFARNQTYEELDTLVRSPSSYSLRLGKPPYVVRCAIRVHNPRYRRRAFPRLSIERHHHCHVSPFIAQRSKARLRSSPISNLEPGFRSPCTRCRCGP